MIRSKFSLSHTRLLSADMGELVPIGLVEVLPGDGIQMSTSLFLRCAPLVTPPMHPVDVRIHHWFVPHRLVWDDWESFITGGEDGENASVFPTINLVAGTSGAQGTPADYFGMPTGINFTVSALPHRAYALIWNEWYRDQQLQTPLVIDTSDGNDTTTNTALQFCGWEKDYFTSARTDEQLGPSVTIPLGGTAPVLGIGVEQGEAIAAASANFIQSDGTAITGNIAPNAAYTTGSIQFSAIGSGTVSPTNRPNIRVDLSSATGVNINDLREALALQRYMEARNRFGARYPEYLRALGVMSSDARLQRPEYLGGGRNVIQFSEVLQTAEGTNPVGEMAGHGIAGVRSNRWRRPVFEEHGYIMSLVSVRPKSIYIGGSPRTFNRRTKEDFWQKELQFIGQQEVLNKEVRAAHATPDGIFGYQDRYDEYRRQESQVSGEFRSTLNTWHFARSFSSDPALNATFIKCVPPDTPFAAPSEDVLYMQAKHSIQARRLVAATGKSMTF